MNSTEFRWPVRGRVVLNYGPQQGGGKNDGINIAVPAGTPIKAAENGVVAYAGSELKGYGKLVLIRHDGDFVTAYAHNSEIDVKRGDKVTRGQVIGKAGQSGDVTQPQLHFEIRKGSTPIDPMTHLSGL
jgi:murein DD-endopeptidase MepM/ murein hydrolase activator NlpD